MYGTEIREEVDRYMYRFRTKTCTNKRCRNSGTCFDAHSYDKRRRVPAQDKHGRFTYIPQHCPEWKKTKTCSLGDSCRRSHGWLEIIFHPLVYKTKMCGSYRRNGVCQKYGLYCAKAHHPTEIRNLVGIYGGDWKHHYDLSMEEKGPDPMSTVNSSRKCFRSRKVPPLYSTIKLNETDRILDKPDSFMNFHSQQNQGGDSTYSGPSLSISEGSDKSESPPLLVCHGIFNRMADLFLDCGTNSYIDLYEETVVKLEGYSHFKIDCKSPFGNLSSESLSLTSNSDIISQSLDDSEICDTSTDGRYNMDLKKTECNKENQLRWGHDNDSKSLYYA